jgi:hypothetical protein
VAAGNSGTAPGNSGQAATAAKAKQQQNTPAPAAQQNSKRDAAARNFTEAELNGGTIPAPQQRAGQ